MKKALLPFLAVGALVAGGAIGTLYAGGGNATNATCGVLAETTDMEWVYFDCTVDHNEDGTEFTGNLNGIELHLDVAKGELTQLGEDGGMDKVEVEQVVLNNTDAIQTTDQWGHKIVMPYIF